MIEIIASLTDKGVRYTIERCDDQYFKINNLTNEIFSCSEEEQQFYSQIEKLGNTITRNKEEKRAELEEIRQLKIIEKRNARKLRAQIGATVLAFALLIFFPIGYSYYEDNKKIEIVLDDEDDVENTFKKVIDEHRTADANLKSELMEYAEILLNRELSRKTYESIINNLANTNLKGVESITSKELANLFKGNECANFLADQLYNFKNDIPVSDNEKYQLLANVLSLYKPATNRIINGADLNTLLKDIYDIEDEFNVNNEKITKEDGLKTQIYVDLTEIETLKEVSSHAFFKNNVFSPYIKVLDETRKCYFYFDKETRQGVSNEVYYRKLWDLILAKEELDYSKKQDRDLVYIYANSFLPLFPYEGDDPIYSIINNTNRLGSYFTQYDLMSYLSGYELDLSNVYCLSDLAMYGEDSIYLLEEVNICLKRDLEEGYISKDLYDRFLDEAYYMLKHSAPNMYDTFKSANDKNESINDFKIKILEQNSL